MKSKLTKKKEQEKEQRDKPFIDLLGELTWDNLSPDQKSTIRKISNPEKISKTKTGKIIIGNKAYDSEEASRIIVNPMKRLQYNKKKEKYNWEEVLEEIIGHAGNSHKREATNDDGIDDFHESKRTRRSYNPAQDPESNESCVNEVNEEYLSLAQASLVGPLERLNETLGGLNSQSLDHPPDDTDSNSPIYSCVDPPLEPVGGFGNEEGNSYGQSSEQNSECSIPDTNGGQDCMDVDAHIGSTKSPLSKSLSILNEKDNGLCGPSYMGSALTRMRAELIASPTLMYDDQNCIDDVERPLEESSTIVAEKQDRLHDQNDVHMESSFNEMLKAVNSTTNREYINGIDGSHSPRSVSDCGMGL